MRSEMHATAPEHVARGAARRGRLAAAGGAWPADRECDESFRTCLVRRLSLLLLALALGIIYGPIAVSTLRDCWNDSNYSHGVLVPLVVLVLMHRRHHDVPALTPRVAQRLGRLAWVLFAAGLAAFAAGTAAAEQFTQRTSGVLVLAGLAGILGGARRLRRYGPPLLLGMGAIPLPYVLFYKLSFPLQLLSARLAASTVGGFGLEVVRSGNIFTVGDHALEVVGACSGIRSMMALCTLAATLAVGLRLSVWRSGLLVLAALPAAMLGNVLRLVVTALLTLAVGERATGGALHEAVGFVGFAAGFGLLVLMLKLLRRGARADTASLTAPAARTWNLQVARLQAWMRSLRPASAAAAWLALGLLVLGAGYVRSVSMHGAEPGVIPHLDALPLAFAGYTGADVPLDDRALDKLSPESYVFRSYSDGRRPEVGLYVAYYRDPREGAQIHSPLHCYPGAGWKVVRSEPLPVRDLQGQPTRMQRLLVQKGARRDVVVYWYDTRTGRLTSDLDLKLNLMRTALLRQPQDAAFVRWSTPIDTGESLERATARLLVAVAGAYPQLEGALPFGG
jgi:exosortase D (VPLPA-CTERM-specific)